MGVHLGLGGLRAALEELAVQGPRPVCLLLTEGADSLESVLPQLLVARPTSFIVVAGDNDGLMDDQVVLVDAVMEERGVLVVRVGLGGSELLASQCLTIVHYLLDRALGASDVNKGRFDPTDVYADKCYPCHFCRPSHPDLPRPPIGVDGMDCHCRVVVVPGLDSASVEKGV